MQRQPSRTVERVLLMRLAQRRNVCRIPGCLGCRPAVVGGAAQTQRTRELFPPSRFDFFQDG